MARGEGRRCLGEGQKGPDYVRLRRPEKFSVLGQWEAIEMLRSDISKHDYRG